MTNFPVVTTSLRATTRKAAKTLFTSFGLRLVLAAITQMTVPRVIRRRGAITSVVPDDVDVGDVH